MSDTMAWHDERRTRIGGSDIAALMGESNYGSPWSVWAEKVGAIPPDLERTEAQQFGLDAEEWLARAFTKATGLHVFGEQLMIRDVDAPHRGATLDGLVGESPNSDIGSAIATWQAKTDRQLGPKWETWENVPARIYLQCMWEMGCAKVTTGWLSVMHAGLHIEHIEIPWNQGVWDEMCRVADAFWFDHVVTGIAPPVDGSDATFDALAAAYPEHIEGDMVEIDPDALDEWHDATAVRKAAERLEKDAKARLVAAIGAAEYGAINGQPVVTFRQQAGRTTECPNCGHSTTGEPFRVLRLKPTKEKKAA
jgi:putative phage-type endonuclease